MSQTLQPGTPLQGGKYIIKQVLGQGGFGITYLATQVSLDRDVAIKEFYMKDGCLRDDTSLQVTVPSTGSAAQVEQYRNKFLKEARTLAGLEHPHIVRVIDVFEENGTVYYSMSYLLNGSLKSRVKLSGALSEDDALRYVGQVASAIKYMHDRNLCHYDIKPDNILLDVNGNAVLIDFGISKNYDAEGKETSTTPIGLSEGFAPIEQYQGINDFSPASDVYALGATLYYLLEGQRPPTAIDRVSGRKLDFPVEVSSHARNLIEQSMAISANARPSTVNSFLEIVNDASSRQDDGVKDDSGHVKGGDDDNSGEIAKDSSHEGNPITSNNDAPIDEYWEDEHSNDKRKYLKAILFVACAGLLLAGGYAFLSNNTPSQADYSAENQDTVIDGVKVVKNMLTTIATLGECKYSGPVNDLNEPNGEGHAKFTNGDRVVGTFVDGKIEGDNIAFYFFNGDKFEGSMKSSKYMKGRYTVAKDGSYFVGTFNANKPSSGQWFDKNGKKITDGQLLLAQESQIRPVQEQDHPMTTKAADPVEKVEERPVKKTEPEKIYTSVDHMPQFPGGESALMKYLISHIQYPAMAAENNVQGKVILQFVVEKDGSIGEVKVARSVDKDLDREAIRLVKSLPRFTPGRQDGQTVRVWYTLPVTFKLQGTN